MSWLYMTLFKSSYTVEKGKEKAMDRTFQKKVNLSSGLEDRENIERSLITLLMGTAPGADLHVQPLANELTLLRNIAGLKLFFPR